MGSFLSSCRAHLTACSKYSFTGLSALSCLFFMIGAISYSLEKDTMENIPWFYITYPNADDDKVYYSLKGQYFEAANNIADYGRFDETRYEKCDGYGYSAYVLVVIACLSSLCCAFLSGALIRNDFTFGQFIGCGLAGLATFMSGIALAVFMGTCQKAMENYTDNAGDFYDYHWGAGSILTAVGMVMMFCVSLGMFLSAQLCGARSDGHKGDHIPAEPVDRMTAV